MVNVGPPIAIVVDDKPLSKRIAEWEASGELEGCDEEERWGKIQELRARDKEADLQKRKGGKQEPRSITTDELQQYERTLAQMRKKHEDNVLRKIKAEKLAARLVTENADMAKKLERDSEMAG